MNNKTTTPKLRCNITGKSRVTNRKYLQAKADKKNTTVEEFLSYYISKDALRQLKAGRTVNEIRSEFPDAMTLSEPSDEWVKSAVKLNGKSGPSGPHAPQRATEETPKQLSPEVQKLVETVQSQEECAAELS
jgi:hypothetical protein